MWLCTTELPYNHIADILLTYIRIQVYFISSLHSCQDQCARVKNFNTPPRSMPVWTRPTSTRSRELRRKMILTKIEPHSMFQKEKIFETLRYLKILGRVTSSMLIKSLPAKYTDAGQKVDRKTSTKCADGAIPD